MTQQSPSTLTDCPSCHAGNTIPLSDGTRLCIECRHEWNPAKLAAIRATSDDELAAEHERVVQLRDDLQVAIDGGYTGPPYASPFDHELLDIATDIERAIDLARTAFVGRRVHVHERNDDGEVIAITDEGLAVVQYASGFSEDLDPDDFSLHDDDDTTTEPSDDVVRAIGETTLTIAQQMIRAAAASFVRDDDGRRLGVPPLGWLPDDGDIMPIVEQASAYAIAVIVYAFDIPDDELELIAARLTITTPTSAEQEYHDYREANGPSAQEQAATAQLEGADNDNDTDTK